MNETVRFRLRNTGQRICTTNLRRLLLKLFECRADLLTPVETSLLDSAAQLIVTKVDLGVVAGPLEIRHLQTHLPLDVLHRPLDAGGKLLHTDHELVAQQRVEVRIGIGVRRRR
jgi:hypothetical protein